jgi:hypothetical protein
MKREWHFRIGDEQRPSVAVGGTVELDGSVWRAVIDNPGFPVVQIGSDQCEAILACISKWYGKLPETDAGD